jgi:large subunit ribosomal protein L25
MANVVTIEAEARARAGKGAARATRRAGRVPGVIYGARQEPSLIALDPRAVARELSRPGWQSRLYEVTINGGATQALIRDVQFHPVTDAPEHVDFQRLASGEPIRVSVPVHFENDGLSPGLKRGGVLNVIRHTVQVYALPEHIPEQFTADLANLDFNDAVRWEDLGGTENTRPAVARNFVVATVAPPTKQAEVAVEATAAAATVAPVAAAAPAAAPARGGAGRRG